MPIVPIVILGLHMAAAVFWLFSSVILGWGQPATASVRLFRSQMVAATVAVFTGGGLWQMLHAGGFGWPERVLALGAVLAIAAAGVQGALVGGQVRRMRSGEGGDARKVLLGQRITTGLLAVVFLCMVLERYV
jgi:hypothetical protein